MLGKELIRFLDITKSCYKVWFSKFSEVKRLLKSSSFLPLPNGFRYVLVNCLNTKRIGPCRYVSVIVEVTDNMKGSFQFLVT